MSILENGRKKKTIRTTIRSDWLVSCVLRHRWNGLWTRLDSQFRQWCYCALQTIETTTKRLNSFFDSWSKYALRHTPSCFIYAIAYELSLSVWVSNLVFKRLLLICYIDWQRFQIGSNRSFVFRWCGADRTSP